MTELERMKTSELKGAALDWAVAKCEEEYVNIDGLAVRYMPGQFSDERQYSPSTNWAQGGPIIELERITLDARESDWQARIWSDELSDFVEVGVRGAYCLTPLIAAMRCYVASKLGDDIDIPEELAE